MKNKNLNSNTTDIEKEGIDEKKNTATGNSTNEKSKNTDSRAIKKSPAKNNNAE